MTELHLDWETRSEVNLKTAGAHIYAAHPSTKILMLGWAFDDDPVSVWEPHKHPKPPADLLDGMRDPTVVCKAANATFERLIAYYVLGVDIPYERWRCMLVKAYYLGFAGGLDDILKQIGLPVKDARGGRLISLFCSPAPRNHNAEWYTWENRPREWEEFVEYCRQDVHVERLLDKWLDQFPSMHDWDWYQWYLDQRMNDRGVHVDVEYANAAVSAWDQERERLTEEMKRHTGLSRVSNVPVRTLINCYIPDRPFECLEKKYVKSRMGKEEFPDFVKTTLKFWQAKEAKASTKYKAVINGAGPDRRVRGMFQYKGASRTDRAGGRRLQLQNLKRPIAKTPEDIRILVDGVKQGRTEFLREHFNASLSDVLGGGIRHIIQAPAGKKLVVADLTSIESVILGWISNCDTLSNVFKANRDSYKTFATELYGIPYECVTPEQRSFCKPPVLGCGYMLGAAGLVAYAEGMGVAMSLEEADKAVKTFRRMYPEIVKFWWDIYDSIKHVTRGGAPVSGYRMTIERDAYFLRIRLPSGRNLSYFMPEIRHMPAPWDPNKTVENFTYMGMDDKRQWRRISAHAGGVTENIVQSIALDVLQNGIVNGYHSFLDLFLQVHDELGAEADEENAERTLSQLIECMTRKPWWAPDLWLGADGFVADVYTKN